MEYNASDEWIVDLGKMTCMNIYNKIVLEFVEEEDAIIGKIRDMPYDLVMELARELAGKTNERKRIKEAVLEAEELFLHAYFENKIKTGIKIAI